MHKQMAKLENRKLVLLAFVECIKTPLARHFPDRTLGPSDILGLQQFWIIAITFQHRKI